MSQISVFNLETMEFASGWQLATPSNLTKEDEFDDSLPGLPKSRENSCAVVASAKDGSSHNIYIFGGVEYQSDGNFNHETGTYGDVWVLSIPSFEWFKVYSPPTRGSPNSAAPTNRKGHTCELVGDRVMMVYGGYSESNEAQAATCDQTGVFAFDLTKLEWMEKYEPDLGQYKVPKQIYSVIGGGPDGGAKLMPQGGLRDDAVNKMFVDAMASLTSEPTGSPTDLDANPDSDTNPDSDAPDAPIGDDTEKGKGNAGAIAGGVVGALVGVALVAGLVFFFLRSRKQRRDLVELSGAEYAPPVEIDSTKPPVEMQSPDQQYDGYYTPAKVELNAHSEATHELPAQFA